MQNYLFTRHGNLVPRLLYLTRLTYLDILSRISQTHPDVGEALSEMNETHRSLFGFLGKFIVRCYY